MTSVKLLQESLGLLGHPAAEHSYATVEAIKDLRVKIIAHLETDEGNKTYGEKAVGISFNPSNLDEVYCSKKTFADAIDQMDELRTSSGSQEQKRLASLAISQIQIAQMCAVKALTWKD